MPSHSTSGGCEEVFPLEEYQALEDTASLLRSLKNARRLFESVAELEPGGGQSKSWGSEARLLQRCLGGSLVLETRGPMKVLAHQKEA